IQEFQAGKVPVFLISLKAGGAGINLTTADTVIHYDPWWNPAAEAQASDRAHRIGQKNPVFVHKLICENTIEERIVKMQQKKAALVEGL
ncbi:SWF/SNF helicase family protein, partial [Escherichia coli]|uniref:helicase-related protein n=2 Tax=Pseudomonadati TaxID=3379134 RepID=UPI0021188FD0